MRIDTEPRIKTMHFSDLDYLKKMPPEMLEEAREIAKTFDGWNPDKKFPTYDLVENVYLGQITQVNIHGGLVRDTVIREVDKEREEFGPYMIIHSRFANGKAGDPKSVKWVNANILEMNGDEPLVDEDVVELKPDLVVKIVGCFDRKITSIFKETDH